MQRPKKREFPLTSNSSTDDTRHHIGRLGSPNGLKGFIGIYVDDADTVLLEPGQTVFLNGDDFRIRALRRGDKGWQVAFEGRPDRNSVDPLRGAQVFVPGRRDLEEDEFWIEDLVGLDVSDDRGVSLGTVTAVVSGPAQDRLVVSGDLGVLEVPFVSDLVPVVDTVAGKVEIKWVEGLLSEPPPQQ